MGPDREVIHVLGMLMRFAYKHSYHSVISVISSVVGELKQLCVPHIFIACYTLRQIIERSVFDDYGVAIRLLDVLYFEGGQELVKFQQYWNLSMCIRMKLMFYLMAIDNDDDLILAKLNEHFPVDGVSSRNHCVLNDKEIIAKQNASLMRFRKFFLSLLTDEERRIAYLQEEYFVEFGANFMADLKEMLNSFLQQIENDTVQTDIERILDGSFDVSRHQQCSITSAAFQVLLMCIQNKQNLTCEDIKHIVSILASSDMLNMTTSTYTSERTVTTVPAGIHRGNLADGNQNRCSSVTHQSVQISDIRGENSSSAGRKSHLFNDNSSVMIIDPEPECEEDVCIVTKSDIARSGIQGSNSVQTNKDTESHLFFALSDSFHSDNDSSGVKIVDVIMSDEHKDSSRQLINHSECNEGGNSVMVITDSDSSADVGGSAPVFCAAGLVQRRLPTVADRIIIEESPVIESRNKSVVNKNECLAELIPLSQTQTQDSTISSSTDSQGTLGSYSSQQGYVTAETSQGPNEEGTALDNLQPADDSRFGMTSVVDLSQVTMSYEVEGGYEPHLQTDGYIVSSDDEEMVTAQSECSSRESDELTVDQCLSSDEERSLIMDVAVSPSTDEDSGMDNDLISRCLKTPDMPLCVIKLHHNKVLENKHRLKCVQLFS